MVDCFLVLNELIDNLSNVDGIVAYSLFQMPEDDDHRASIFKRFLGAGKEMHFACERLCITQEDQIERVEKIILVQKALPNCNERIYSHG
jgi:sporadic carbohydrate cluster protein (TIGR04323 family)